MTCVSPGQGRDCNLDYRIYSGPAAQPPKAGRLYRTLEWWHGNGVTTPVSRHKTEGFKFVRPPGDSGAHKLLIASKSNKRKWRHAIGYIGYSAPVSAAPSTDTKCYEFYRCFLHKIHWKLKHNFYWSNVAGEVEWGTHFNRYLKTNTKCQKKSLVGNEHWTFTANFWESYRTPHLVYNDSYFYF